MSAQPDPPQRDLPAGLAPGARNAAGAAKDALLRYVAEALEAREQEGEGAIERICAEHSADAPRIRQRIELLRELGLLDVWSGVVFRDDSPNPRP